MRISDWSSDVCSSDLKDPIFARMNLNDEEFALYRQIYQHLQLQASAPDLVIYLQTPVDALVERVNHRNVSYEQGIPREYLSRLANAYRDRSEERRVGKEGVRTCHSVWGRER